MGPDGITENAFLKASGDAAEGLYATLAWVSASELSAKGQEFANRYKERFGSEAELSAAYACEAANVLLDAIQRAYDNDGEVTRQDVVRELFATKNYEGVLGNWSFEGRRHYSCQALRPEGQERQVRV